MEGHIQELHWERIILLISEEVVEMKFSRKHGDAVAENTFSSVVSWWTKRNKNVRLFRNMSSKKLLSGCFSNENSCLRCQFNLRRRHHGPD